MISCQWSYVHPCFGINNIIFCTTCIRVRTCPPPFLSKPCSHSFAPTPGQFIYAKGSINAVDGAESSGFSLALRRCSALGRLGHLLTAAMHGGGGSGDTGKPGEALVSVLPVSLPLLVTAVLQHPVVLASMASRTAEGKDRELFLRFTQQITVAAQSSPFGDRAGVLALSYRDRALAITRLVTVANEDTEAPASCAVALPADFVLCALLRASSTAIQTLSKASHRSAALHALQHSTMALAKWLSTTPGMLWYGEAWCAPV